VLAVAGITVFAFRKPDAIGDFSLFGHPHGLLEGEENLVASGGMRTGVFRLAETASILSETAGARDNESFQRLNRMACIDG
jgi:glutamine cyclotransferase